MSSIRELPKRDKVFYLNQKDEVQYNKQCVSCARECKQSYRSTIVSCKRIPAKSKRLYLNRIKQQGKTIKQVADEIGIHSRTLKSLLTNKNKDISYEIHEKLMKVLYDIDISKK